MCSYTHTELTTVCLSLVCSYTFHDHSVLFILYTDDRIDELMVVVGAVFGCFCAILMIAISFFLGLLLGKRIQRRKNNQYEVIPALSGVRTIAKPGWNSSHKSPSQTLCIPPPLPGERSTHSSREDIRGSTVSLSTSEQVDAPQYAVLEGPTPPKENHNGGITSGQTTTGAAMTEPEYALPSITSRTGQSPSSYTCQDVAAGSCSSYNSANFANGPAHEYAVLEEPKQNSATSPTSSQVPAPVVKIVIQDESGQEAPLETVTANSRP